MKLLTTLIWPIDSANLPMAISWSSFIFAWYVCHLLLVLAVKKINTGYIESNIKATGQEKWATIIRENMVLKINCRKLLLNICMKSLIWSIPRFMRFIIFPDSSVSKNDWGKDRRCS